MPEKNYNIGLVLSGGGARGFAHLGVMQALNENGIFPDVISGTSAGALAGVLYADGYTPKEILKMMNSLKKYSYLRPTVPREGLMQFAGIIRLLRDNLRAKRFEDLKIPFFATATDLNNGKAVYFSEGELLNPVIASASIPVIFKPVMIDNIQYVDGGVIDNMPVRPIEDKCNFIIGSFVNPSGFEGTITNLINIAERTFLLSMSREMNSKVKKFDLFIAPIELKEFKVLDPEKSDIVFEIGYRSTIEKLKQLDFNAILSKSSL
jgi:NTE family protein